MIFFVSHSHPDHFNPEILSYGEGRDNIYYCLSSDIMETYGFEPSPEISVMKPDGHYLLKAGTESLEVETLGSTDRGVAFIVKYNGRVIYHAGDLNCWAWPGDAEETRAKEIADAIRAFYSMDENDYLALCRKSRTFWKEHFDAENNYQSFVDELHALI